MKKIISIDTLYFTFLCLYIALVSVLNYTPFYIISAVLLVGISLIVLIQRKKLSMNAMLFFHVLMILYAIIYVLLGLSVSENNSISIIKTLMLNYAISFSIFSYFTSVEKVEKTVSFYLKYIILGLLFIILYTGGTGAEGRLAQDMPRPFSDTGFNSIEVGMLAVWGSICSLYLFFKSRKKVLLLPQILFWVVILWSGSRDCTVFGFLSLVYLYFFCGKTTLIEKAKKVVGIAVVLLAGILVIFNVPSIYNVIGYRFLGYFNQTEMSAVSRETMKETAIIYMQKQPIIGYGLGSFSTFQGSYGTWAHNNYLELMIGGGLIILLLYYIPIFYYLIKAIKIKKKSTDIYFSISLIILSLLHSLVGVTYMSRMGNLFLIISISIIINSLKNEKGMKKNEQN